MKKSQFFDKFKRYRNGILASNELIVHSNVADNLIKIILSLSKPLNHQKARSFLIFSTGVRK